MIRPNVEILCDSHNGIYIPQIMAQRLVDNGWNNISVQDLEVLSNPDNDCYWDTWNTILDNSTLTDESTSQVFRLHHDGDLFAVCHESCTPSEYYNIFGEYPEWYNQEEE